MKKRKLTKTIGVLLVVAMLTAIMSVMSLAAAPAEIKVVKMPDRTVLFEDYDTVGTDAYCEPEGMILEVKNDDGSTDEVECTFENTLIRVQNYKLGENEAVVTYGDSETVITVTVEETPVKSVEITKMPAKTEYDWDKDVISRDSSFDDFLEMFPGLFEEILEEEDMTVEELKAFYAANPKAWDEIVNGFLEADEGFFIPDFTGMEIKVTYKDGTSEVLGYEDDFSTYGGYKFPVMVDAEDAGFVKVGENRYFVYVMGVETPFTITIKKAAPVTPEVPNPPKDDIKNPVIPNTDGTSLAFAAIALMASFGTALVVSKKEK